MKNSTLFILISLFSYFGEANDKATSTSNLAKSFEVREDIFSKKVQPVLENIICDGNKKTKCSLIKKEIYLKRGSKVNEEELQNSKIRLQLLGLFNNVEFKLEKGSSRGKVNLRVIVDEASAYYSVSGVSAGKNKFDDKVQLQGQYTVGNNNLFGKGKRLSGTVDADLYGSLNYKRTSFRLRYTDPNLFGSKKWFLNSDLIYEHYNSRISNANSYLGSIEIGRRFLDFSYITAGYGARNYNYNSSVYENENIKDDFVSIGYGFNSQDDQYFATSGARLDLRLNWSTNFGFESDRNGGTVHPVFTDFDWRYTLALARKQYLALFAESRGLFDNEDLLNQGLGFEYSYQVKRNQHEHELTDLRLYSGVSFIDYRSSRGARYRASAGVKLRSKNFGLVRFNIFGDL